MKLFIDSSLDYLFVFIADNKNTVKTYYLKKLQKKSEQLHSIINQCLKKSKTSIDDIKEILITIGPGSFMGTRASLIYAKTICAVKNIPLKIASSFSLFFIDDKKTNARIDAKGQMMYEAMLKNKKIKIKMTKKLPSYNFEDPNYKAIIKNPSSLFQHFKKVKNVFNITPLYLKTPTLTKYSKRGKKW